MYVAYNIIFQNIFKFVALILIVIYVGQWLSDSDPRHGKNYTLGHGMSSYLRFDIACKSFSKR